MKRKHSGELNAKGIAVLHSVDKVKAYIQSLPEEYQESVRSALLLEWKRRKK